LVLIDKKLSGLIRAMIQVLYIEEEVLDHPRTREICKRFPKIKPVVCKHYGEIFNRRSQNFRLQKNRPSLILAQKHNNFVLEAPQGYGIGSNHNYYFSHMMNCVYDCRYCFLQGMYRSANYVLFVNYEDFGEKIARQAKSLTDQQVTFFSGYDCDSLALDPVSKFTDYILPLFRSLPNACLELRTKSTQVRKLLDTEPFDNCVVAFSFSPDVIASSLEHKAPSVSKRLDSLVKLQQRGWKIGLRFDPLIYHDGFTDTYETLFRDVLNVVSVDQLHSVSLGTFRMPDSFFKNVVNLYPDEKLFAGPLEKNNGMVAYQKEIEQEMVSTCTDKLMEYVPEHLFYPCVV